MFLVLGAVCLSTPSINAVAAPTTITTLSPSIVLAGNAYARHLLEAQPLPLEAREVAVLPTPIELTGPIFQAADVRVARRFYLLPSSVPVYQYVRAHLPKGATVMGTGSSGGPGVNPVHDMTVSLTCVSRHITFCGVTYATTVSKNGKYELAVAVQVIYLPILHVQMPTDGVVTVTGYGKTSLIFGSSDPSRVVLTHDEALRLHSAILGLKDLGSNGGCQEDSVLLKISVVKNGKTFWKATADACPGALTISSASTNAILDSRACSFWHAVDSFFPSGAADATKTGTKSCNSSLYG